MTQYLYHLCSIYLSSSSLHRPPLSCVHGNGIRVPRALDLKLGQSSINLFELLLADIHET